MLDEKTIEELHSYYDRLPGGICLVKADDSEEILLANAELLNYYQCANWQEFKELTGGTYRGMVEASDYIPLKDIVRVKGQPEANYAYFQFPYRTREGHFNKGNALLIRTTQKGLGDIWSINVMKSKYSRAPGETENITGLLGGTAFYKRVNEHIQMEKIDGTGGLYCSVYFNLTNFKLYNSNYGIEQGDELLRKVADVLRAHFPYSIIAHLNADNFALVAPRDGVIEQVEAVCREVDEMIDNFSITLKAGVFFRDPDKPSEYTANSAFDMAKIACDSIKGDASRSWATYTETMGKNLVARAYVLENFDRALRNGYIKIFYQPVVRTLTGKLCGMEALARWEDPERGRLTPDMFVPVLEDAKLIYKLDSYVVEQVGKRLRTMEDSGMPVLPISVNLSSADFDQVDPLDVVERVVMSDPDTYNLVYLNKALRHDLGLTEDEDITGKKCYEVLEGAKSPCEFCTNERLSRDYFYKWVHHDARTGQDYIMRDILVPWRGKNYRFTFSTCLKDYVGKYLKENGEIVGKSAANEMIAIAIDERDPDASIDKMLESIGEALKADKVMIFEEDEENVSATYEWKKEGVPSTIDKLQKIPREKAKALYQGYVPSEVTIINDPERMNKALKDGNISAVKINSLVSGHLAINRKSFGFVEVVNPAPDRLKDASLLLTAVTRFLSVLIRNRDIYKRLRQLGNTDQLTGVMNRHRFMGLMQHIPQGEPIALIYADFNDLKDINDTDGHEAGDEALRKMACAMCSVVDQNRVFRVGGDEFIAVAEEVNLDDVKEIVKKMRQAFDEQGVSAALGYGIFKMPIDDIEAAIAEVDHWMYYDKRRAKEEQHKDQGFIPDHLPEKTAGQKEEGKENPEQ